MENLDQDHEKENRRVVKAAGTVGLATLLSRIFGFLRDMVVAAFFGAGLATDAFFVAFRIPNLLRRLFAEGSLTIAFVPVFTEYLKKKSKEDAFELANIAVTLLSIILAFVSLIGILLSPFIVMLIAPGFTKVPAQYELTVLLTRFMFPYIFFISLVALCMGILNSLRHFAAPALAPVALNISIIITALTLRHYFSEPIFALAVGVMIGGILQLAMQIPVLRSLGVRLKPNFHFRHPGIRKIGLLMLPAVFGAAVYQVNIFVGTLLASFLPEGSVSYLYYADRVVQLPLGIFGIAIGTASLPSFSEQVARGDYGELKKTLSFSLQLILFVTIPAMVALIVLREPIISVLFQRGKFDLLSTVLTSRALLYYALGLCAFSAIRIIVSAFYSLQDTKTPVRIAVIAIVANIILSIALMFPLRHAGLALATSIASFVNVILLFIILKGRIGAFLERDFFVSIGKVTASSLAMGGFLYLTLYSLHWTTESPFDERILILTISICGGIVLFAVLAWLLKCSEMSAILESVRSRAASRRKSRKGTGRGTEN
jgi:putative peptidoglycan lipid II flippase